MKQEYSEQNRLGIPGSVGVTHMNVCGSGLTDYLASIKSINAKGEIIEEIKKMRN